jgi:hypothetical protein
LGDTRPHPPAPRADSAPTQNCYACDQRGVAEPRDVGQHWHPNGGRELTVFLKRRQSFGKDHVGTYLNLGKYAVDVCLLAFNGAGVGARNDDKLGIGAPLDSRLDAVDHLGRCHKCLSGLMTAAFGGNPVFEVHASGRRPELTQRRYSGF